MASFDKPARLSAGPQYSLRFAYKLRFGCRNKHSERQTILLDLTLSGDEGIRTPDLRRAKAALSQLSYGPSREDEYAMVVAMGQVPAGWSSVVVGHSGLEPETSVLSGLRSNLLS